MLELEIFEDFSHKEQEFKAWKLVDRTKCLAHLSNEYRTLRTACKTPINQVNVEGIGVVDTAQIKSYLESKTIPFRQEGAQILLCRFSAFKAPLSPDRITARSSLFVKCSAPLTEISPSIFSSS
jgi:hypothetical protein